MRSPFKQAVAIRRGDRSSSLRKIARMFRRYPGFLESGAAGLSYKDDPNPKYLNSSRTKP